MCIRDRLEAAAYRASERDRDAGSHDRHRSYANMTTTIMDIDSPKYRSDLDEWAASVQVAEHIQKMIDDIQAQRDWQGKDI